MGKFFSGRWTPQPFAWKTKGSVAHLERGHGEVSLNLCVPGGEHRGWADLVISARGAFIGAPVPEDTGLVRLSPADVRKLRDELSKLVDDSEVQAFGGRV